MKDFTLRSFSPFLVLFPFAFAYCLRGQPLYFVVPPSRRHAVAKLDETRYRIERAITASSRVGARLLTRLYVAETLNCMAQRELTPAKTASSNDAPQGRTVKNNRGGSRKRVEPLVIIYHTDHEMVGSKAKRSIVPIRRECDEREILTTIFFLCSFSDSQIRSSESSVEFFRGRTKRKPSMTIQRTHRGSICRESKYPEEKKFLAFHVEPFPRALHAGPRATDRWKKSQRQKRATQ